VWFAFDHQDTSQHRQIRSRAIFVRSFTASGKDSMSIRKTHESALSVVDLSWSKSQPERSRDQKLNILWKAVKAKSDICVYTSLVECKSFTPSSLRLARLFSFINGTSH